MTSTGGLMPLTGLPDRASCLARAATLAGLPASPGRALAVLWIDIDRFQAINRALGHAGGDQVILQIANRIRARIPGRSELHHLGADEFVLLVPDATRAEMAELGGGLRNAVAETLELGTIQLHPTAAVGIALHEPGEDATELLARADRAKHDAKEQGRDQCVFSGEERVVGRHGALLEREELQVEDDLHEALDHGGLALHYQPILRRDGSVEAVEALMRCSVRGRGTRPDVLIRVAEKTGLIGRLGDWSLMEAAGFARRLEDEGLPTKVAVNVSAAQLTSPNFALALSAAVIVADIDAARLELEVTESMFLHGWTEVRNNLDFCTDKGNPLAIDDFGTGESSLAKLISLRVGKLKLDRAFVHALPGDRRAFAVVRAVAQLGRDLGMTVVAEGVETAEQQEVLWQAGVDAVQGYLHARPMDGEALIGWLRSRRA
jgi:diguanylate cyclase (GGDEF)-like protein